MGERGQEGTGEEKEEMNLCVNIVICTYRSVFALWEEATHFDMTATKNKTKEHGH